jgi:predicted RNA-binding protein
MNYYIFVNSRSFDLDDKGVPSQIISSHRLKNKVFPVYPRTKYKNLLKPNDAFIFYVAGKRVAISCSFVAYGLIAEVSENHPYSEDDLHLSGAIEKIVKLKSIVEKKPLSIYGLKDKLSFITKKKKWGSSMQGGIIQITEEDYNLITKEMNK